MIQTNRVFVLLAFFTAILLSCNRSYEETNDYVSYYDNEHKIKKVEGRFFNNRETGQWVFYSKNSYEVKKGNYVDGLQSGQWKYKFPFLDSALFWVPYVSDNLEFSLPSTFRFHESTSVNNTKTFVDTNNHTILSISIIDNCDKKCVLEYHNYNLNDFAYHKSQVLSSQSVLVNSKKGDFYLDEFIIRRPDYDNEIKEYMTYIPVNENKLLVLTITNQKKFDGYLRFLIGEVFYHCRFNYERVAFPYEELLKSPEKFK